MKLIELDALVAEIKRLKNHYDSAAKEFGDEGYKDNVLMEQAKSTVCERVLSLTDTLEVKEVDFEKELDRIWFDNKLGGYFNNDALDFAHIRTICKHFFELGLNTQRKSVSIQNIDDVLKELGIDPYSREAKKLKESYYTAMDKLLAQKGE